MKPTRAQQIEKLRDRLFQMERGQRQPRDDAAVSTGVAALDCLLPGNGLAGGTLLEWVGAGEGSGAMTLALILAARVQEFGGAVVVIDPGREFHPPAARALGVSLARTLIVQPGRAEGVPWAWEQSLRSPAAAVVLGSLERINDRLFRRLQLATEAGGSLGMLVRPATCRAEPSWASARLLVEALPSDVVMLAPRRRVRIELLYRRGGLSNGAIEVELSDEANALHLVSVVADSAAARRAGGERG